MTPYLISGSIGTQAAASCLDLAVQWLPLTRLWPYCWCGASARLRAAPLAGLAHLHRSPLALVPWRVDVTEAVAATMPPPVVAAGSAAAFISMAIVVAIGWDVEQQPHTRRTAGGSQVPFRRALALE